MSERIKALRQQSADLVAANTAILESASVDEPLSEDLEKTLAGNKTKLNSVNRRIGIEEETMEADRTLGTVVPADAGPAVETHVRLADKPWQGEDVEAQFGDFLTAVATAEGPGATVDPRLVRAAGTGANEGIPADGGFLVQKMFMDRLVNKMFDSGQLLQRAEMINLGNPRANGLKINRTVEISRRNGSRWGGIQAYWLKEAGLKTATQPEFEQVELNLHKLIGLMYSTDELLQDAPALGQVMTRSFNDEFRFKVEDAIINGTGAGQPLGILNSGGRVTVAKETGQLANTIVVQNLVNMYSRADIRNRMNMIWVYNQDIEPQLLTLGITIGTGGLPIYMPAGSIAGTPFATLFGRPMIPVEYAATLGTEGDIMFLDMSEYIMIQKGGIQSDSSIHVRFLYDETTFRFVYRVDGQPAVDTPLTPYKGSLTVSPYITLATRA